MATNLKPLFKYNANEANKREAILASYQVFSLLLSIFALAVSLALLCDRLNKIFSFLFSPSSTLSWLVQFAGGWRSA